MKRKIFSVILILASLCGCTVTRTIYLQDVVVNGPVSQPPLNITDERNSNFTVSPRIFVHTKSSVLANNGGHSPVDSRGVFIIDTAFNSDGTIKFRSSPKNSNFYKGDNLRWNIPDFTAGIDLNYKFSDHFAISAGFDYSTEDRKSFTGGYSGIGFFNYENRSAIRLDIGVKWQTLSYDALTVIEYQYDSIFGSGDKEIFFYHDIGKFTSTDPYIALTYNTAGNSPLNFYLGAGYFTQSLTDFQPSSWNEEYHPFGVIILTQDFREETTAGFLYINPGVYFNIGETGRLIIGSRILFETQIEESDNSVLVIPQIKFDLLL